ncbi:MAG: hypothetical protein HY929_04665 [Euryarchaeota archaeon]|nr:hypothetical protein [Euryarchaeota archaeon]
MPKIDRLVLLEIAVGIMILGISLVSFSNTYQRFGQGLGYGHGELVPIEKIEEKWYSAFMQTFRSLFLAFISGLILMHGILSLRAPKTEVLSPEEVPTEEPIKLVWNNQTILLELFRDLAPKTCSMILSSLPFESEINELENGICFRISETMSLKFLVVKIEPENQRLLVKAGDVGYSPVTESIYIFYGKAQSVLPLNIFAKVKG